jgi:hypothetical protein
MRWYALDVSARRASAMGATLFSLAAAFVLAAAGAPTVGCYPCSYPCPSAFDMAGFCLTPNGSNQPSTCLVDGQPVTQCDPGSCPPWTLASGSTLTIPAGSLWSTLGSRHDLHWFVNCLSPSSTALEASVPEASTDGSPEDAAPDASPAFESAIPQMPGTLTVLFDGVPAQGCVCTANSEITCRGVATTVQTIGFRYVEAAASDGGSDGGSASSSDAGSPTIGLAIAFDVGECLPTHIGCPHSDVPEGSAY